MAVTDLNKIRQSLSTTADQMRKVHGMTPDEFRRQATDLARPFTADLSAKDLRKYESHYSPGYRAQIEGTGRTIDPSAFIKQYESAYRATQAQANRAADAFGLQGNARLDTIADLDKLRSSLPAKADEAKAGYSKAAKQAEQYVQEARFRTDQAMRTIEDLGRQLDEGRDFAKAHDMQAATFSILANLDSQERAIIAEYGHDSAELAQYQDMQTQQLGAVQSQIHAQYQKLAETARQTVMSLSADTLQKHNMYTNYHEQRHVAALETMAQAEAMYDLRVTETAANLARLRGSEYESLANWMVETPVFSTDGLGMLATLAESRPAPVMTYGAPSRTVSTPGPSPTSNSSPRSQGQTGGGKESGLSPVGLALRGGGSYSEPNRLGGMDYA